ncbi:crossover junction endodeoxyribonuclease RuvC [bacterium]|nr:crossover junction endodeoxyribonuclease RuvC [candidate division CSSED10-310 bacterium]
MRILGIDPGSQRTGFGIVSACGARLDCISYGCIRLPADKPVPYRLRDLFDEMNVILDRYRVNDMAVENLFTGKNAQSILKLGQIRGVILLSGIRRGLPIGEYPPATVKQSLVGYGRADKPQVQYMVQKILKLPGLPRPADAADALAVAICHANNRRLERRLECTT